MAGENDKWEMYADKRGEHRWRRRATNGKIVGSSCEGYTKKADCKKNAQRHGMDGNPDGLGAKDRWDCLLYTSPSPRDLSTSRMPSSA